LSSTLELLEAINTFDYALFPVPTEASRILFAKVLEEVI